MKKETRRKQKPRNEGHKKKREIGTGEELTGEE